MKKNNSLNFANKFINPEIGFCALASDYVDFSWQGNNLIPQQDESFEPGMIAMVTDIRVENSGIKVIQMLYNEKTIIIPFKLKKLFYFIKPTDLLNGKTFCITGGLEYDRKFYESLICLFGGTYKINISENIDYLITNANKKTNKLIKAKQSGVKIINENKFWELLER